MVHVPAPAPVPRMPYPMPRPQYSPPQRAASGARGVLIAAAVLVFAGGLVAFLIAADHGFGNKSFQWRNAVIPVAIDGDGVEDFVGIYASRGGDYPVYVAAFDGAKYSELWKAGPFGKSASELEVTVVGTSVVAIDARPVAHILALKTGKETGKVSLSDKARSVCAPPDAKGKLWVETSDQKAVLIDLATARAQPAPRPASCPPVPSDCDHVHSALAGCQEDKAAPPVDGFRAEFVLSQGSDGVAVGSRSPGTATPMAVGFDAKTRSVRWQRPLVGSPPSAWEADLHAVDMAGGRLIAEYASDQPDAGRLMAVDVKTGKVLWDVAVPNTDHVATASDMAITPTRVYLPHWTWLDVFDVKNGAHITTLGAW
jgi:outer membrane protein assembly factor BamB